MSLRSSTTDKRDASTNRTTTSVVSVALRNYKQYYAYDADPDDELFTDLMQRCNLPPISLSIPALEEMLAALEHQLEWAYYTLEYTTQGQNSYLSYQSNIAGAAALIAGYDEYLAGTALPRNRRDPPLQRLKLTMTNLASSSTSNGSSSSSSGPAGASVAREAYQDLFVREPAMDNPYLLPVGTSRHRSSSSHSARARARKSAQSSTIPAARVGGGGGDGVEKRLFADEGEDEEPMTTNSTASGSVTHRTAGHSGDMHVLERRNRIRQLLPYERVATLLADLALQHAEVDGSGLKSVLKAGDTQLLVDKLKSRGLMPTNLEHALTSSSSSSSQSTFDVCHAVYQYWALKRAGRSTSLLRAFHRFAMRN